MADSETASSVPSASTDEANSQLPYEQRTLVLAKPSGDLLNVCLALTLQAKNLYNTALFAVRNVLSAYEKSPAGYQLKADLHEHQTVAIARFNEAVVRINAARVEKFPAQQLKAKAQNIEVALKLIPELTADVESITRIALDITVLDNVLRTWPNEEGVCVYGRLPAKAAQQVMRKLKDGYSGYFEALKRFTAGGSAMTGRPQAPDYLAKDSRFVLELPLTQMSDSLIDLGKRDIPLDFEESMSLTEAEMAAWNDYELSKAIRHAVLRRGYGEGAVPQHLRIVPVGHSQVKLEVVVRVPSAVPESSYLAKVLKALGSELEAAKSASKQNDVLLNYLQDKTIERCAGVDFGVSNTAALAFSTGHRAKVISGGRLERVLNDFDAKLDARVSLLTSPDTRALQARKEELRAKNERLPRADEMLLRKSLKAMYQDALYRTLRTKREHWLSDYLHKLSRGIVEACRHKNIEVLVLGKNTGWKDGINMGKRQNRRFGNVPIARLIEQIRYKAQAKGMLVVTTEESYTSKTSFVNNEELKVYSKTSSKTPRASKTATKEVAASGTSLPCSEAALTPVAADAATLPSPLKGKRLKNDRNTFVNHPPTGRWARVHADVNAAFNMLRKVFKGFAYSQTLTLKYDLMRLSPRLGLARMENLGVGA